MRLPVARYLGLGLDIAPPLCEQLPLGEPRPDSGHRCRCGRTMLPRVPFDETAAAGLSSDEVRRRWPRIHWKCAACKNHGVAYASFVHYISGDW